jgi:hypothetical protein
MSTCRAIDHYQRCYHDLDPETYLLQEQRPQDL